MNVNSELIIKLHTVTGYPVVPDLYTGKEDKWITFSYEDERSALDGDNYMLYEEAIIQVSLFTPKDFNYFADKNKIKHALIELDYGIEYIKSWLTTDIESGTSKYRQTVFVAHITKQED